MMKTSRAACVSITSLFFAMYLYSFQIDKINHRFPTKNTSSLSLHDMHRLFQPENVVLSDATVITDPIALLTIARDTLAVMNKNLDVHHPLFDPPLFRDYSSYPDTIKTLQFLIATIEADLQSGSFRIQNPEFIMNNFNLIRWSADTDAARQHAEPMVDDHQIRLTYYVIYEDEGSAHKSKQHPCALYKVLDHSICHRFTKQEIVDGALEHPSHARKVTALCWVSRNTLERALLQGTVIIKFLDGRKEMFSVDKHNSFIFDKKNKGASIQKRYWFFKKIHHNKNYIDRVARRAHVVFAGDVHSIGFGKLILLHHRNPLTKKPQIQLGFLVDAGGAFRDTMYKLDVFAGIFSSPAAMRKHIKYKPTHASAYIAVHASKEVQGAGHCA